MAAAIRRQIERADGLGPTVRDRMLAILRQKFPELYAEKKVDKWDDESVVYFTENGMRTRQAEIDELVNVKMRDNAKAIGEAAARGDLSENSEYRFAIEERDLLRARLAQLNADLALARVLDPDRVATDHVDIGQRVTLAPEDGGDSVVLTLLGAGESDDLNSCYSYQTPLAKQLLGSRMGDVVTVAIEGADRKYRVERLENALAAPVE